MLIAGCSHAAGFEINGEQDCDYNRQHSFGNILAGKMGLEPVNIAMGSISNPAIVRSVKEYINSEEKPKHVLVAFTELTRLDIPSPFDTYYAPMNPSVDWYNGYMDNFLQINSGWHGANDEEKALIPYWHEYQAKQEKVMWLHAIQLQWGLQQFLQAHNISYTFCNTMDMYPNPNNKDWVKFCTRDWAYIDTDNYMDAQDKDKAFYWYYRNLGYQNTDAEYWHHDETPHALYADKLYNFIKER